MRVLIVQKRFHTNSLGIVRGLKARGHEVHMIVHETKPPEDWRDVIPVVVPYSRWSTLPFRDVKGRNKFAVPRLVRLTRTMRTMKPDVVVLKKARLPALLAGVIGRLLGAELVLLSDRPPKPNPALLDRIARRVGFTPRVRICTSVAADRMPVDGWVNGARWLPYPVEAVPRRAPRTTAPAEDGRRVRILSVGSYNNARKRLHWVLDAILQAGLEDDVAATFVGVGSPTSLGAKEIEWRIREYGLADVELRFNLTFDELQDVYAAHDVFVLPARTEPFGAVVPEAMAHGLAVICSDTTGARGCFEDGVSGLVFRADSLEALAGRLAQVVRDPQVRERLGAAALARVRTTLSPDGWAYELERLVA